MTTGACDNNKSFAYRGSHILENLSAAHDKENGRRNDTILKMEFILDFPSNKITIIAAAAQDNVIVATDI